MRLVTLAALTACLLGAVLVSAQETEKDDYKFSYQTDSSFRKELKGADGKILGEYGFRTPDGCMHVVKYQADIKGGYRILGSSKRGCVHKALLRLAKSKSKRPISRTTTTTSAPRTFLRRTTTERPLPTRVPIPRPTARIFEPVNNAIDVPTTRRPSTTRRPTTTLRPTTTRRPTTTPRPRRTTTTTTPRPRPTTPKIPTTTPKRPKFAKALTPDEPEPSYTFGFTTPTHGHTESGLPDGGKKGEYFIDFPNGRRQTVTYIADKNGFRPKIVWSLTPTPTTTAAPPTTTPDTDEEGDSIGKQLLTPTIPSGGFGCPYYFYYNTRINYHWEYCQLNGTKLGEFGRLADDGYVHVNNYYADARGFHPTLSKELMTPEQEEAMAEYQSGAYILPKPDEERRDTEKRIQAFINENRQRLANPLKA